MKIEFSRAQYRALVEAVAIVHAVSDDLRDAGEEGSEARHREMNSLEDYVVQHAPLFDCLDLVDNEGGMLTLNDATVAKLMDDVMLPYDEEAFWRELIESLVERDLRELEGEVDTNSEFLEQQLYKKYEEEFEENGIENLYLSE